MDVPSKQDVCQTAQTAQSSHISGQQFLDLTVTYNTEGLSTQILCTFQMACSKGLGLLISNIT